jgi:hypothetical protein
MFYAWFIMQMEIDCKLNPKVNPDGSVNSFSRITEKIDDKIMEYRYNKFIWTKKIMPFHNDDEDNPSYWWNEG